MATTVAGSRVTSVISNMWHPQLVTLEQADQGGGDGSSARQCSVFPPCGLHNRAAIERKDASATNISAYPEGVVGYPRYYAVNDRPVKLVELPTGEIEAHVFDFATGGFRPDPTYLLRITGGGDVDEFTELAAFERLVAAQRWAAAERRHARKITWEHTGDEVVPYRTRIDGKLHEIRVNDFPSQPLYTLLIDGKALEDLDDWPSAWIRPPTPQAVLDRLAKTRLS